jgi:uncharacterized protein YndB with AHSA1/START domain
MANVINLDFFYPHPPETVWEYLTNPELIELWLMKNDFRPIVEADFQLRTDAIPSLNFDGIFYCKVLEIAPFRKLVYSMSGGPGEGKITLDSLVVWTLEPTDKGTKLILAHSGFDKEEDLNFFKGFAQGWVEKFNNIDKLLKAATHGHANA